MRVLCRHGHFAFYPELAGQLAMFSNYFGVELVRDEDFYTFELLKGAPHHSIVGNTYLGKLARVTYAGDPWEVFKANGFVFNVAKGILSYAEEITAVIRPPQVAYYFLSETPLIQPGSQHAFGGKVMSYDGVWMQDELQLRLSEFAYD